MVRWTYLGPFGHKAFATETAEDMAQAIAALETWMNRQATTVLLRRMFETEATAVDIGTLRSTDPSTVEEVFVIPQMSGGA